MFPIHPEKKHRDGVGFQYDVIIWKVFQFIKSLTYSIKHNQMQIKKGRLWN